MANQVDIVVEETNAPIRDSRWMATFGGYDLDCMVGTGATPLDAIRELLDEEEFWNDAQARNASWEGKPTLADESG